MAGANGQIAGIRSYIIDSMWYNRTFRIRLEIMVKSLWCALTQDFTATFEIANHLPFLRINTEYGNPFVKALPDNIVYLLKLRVPVFYVLECLELYK